MFAIGETPSKRRKMSIDSKDSKDAAAESSKPESNTESKMETKSETKSKNANEGETPETNENEGSKPENKTEGKSDLEPDIKENLGSPRPVTRQESPEPGPSELSKTNEARQPSRDQEEAGSSGQSTKRQDSEEEPQRARPRERPIWVDIVAKHVESLFSLLSKSESDS